MRTLMLLLAISRTIARSVGRSAFVSCKSPGVLSAGWNMARRFSQQPAAPFPEEARTAIADYFEDVRNDRVELPTVSDQALKKNLNLRCFTNLTKYARELDEVLRRATFVGCTTLAKANAMTSCLLHFRGYERAESLCLCFDPKHFPLFPTIPTPFKGVTERSMDHFERTLAGIGGLRVTRVHTPYPFRSVLAIDFADPESPDAVIYKLVTVSERTNRLLLVDNTDQMVMGTSECLNEHDLKEYEYVGKKLELTPHKKTLPTGEESLEEFRAHFKQLNDASVARALLTVFQGIDYDFVQALCAELEIEPASYFYRVPDVSRLHELFAQRVRAALSNDGRGARKP